MTTRLPKVSGKAPRYALRKWHAQLAYWLSEQPVTPSIPEQLAAANGFANVGRKPEQPPIAVTLKKLRVLKAREDFQGLVRELEKGGIEAARAKFLSHLGDYVEMHLWGARRSMEKDDTRALASYTVPALDRVAPKRGAPLIQQEFHIELSAARRESILNPERPVIEATLISPEHVEDEPPAASPPSDSDLIPLAEAMRRRREIERYKDPNEDPFADFRD